MAQSYVATGREAAAYIGRLKAALRDIRDMEVVDAGSMEAVQRAGAALSVETAVKPVCLRDTEAHGKGICEICEDGPCADEPTNNGIYAETWDERMGRKP